MPRDSFQDRKAEGAINGGAWYEWPIGHDEEDPQDKTQNVERTALTTGVGVVRQQGAPTPTILKLKGWIVQPEQLEKMEAFYNACAGIGTVARTVWFKDIEGHEHEVLIVAFKPQRKIGRSGGTGLNYVWRYDLEMELIS